MHRLGESQNRLGARQGGGEGQGQGFVKGQVGGAAVLVGGGPRSGSGSGSGWVSSMTGWLLEPRLRRHPVLGMSRPGVGLKEQDRCWVEGAGQVLG